MEKKWPVVNPEIITNEEADLLSTKFVAVRKALYALPNYSKSALSPEEKEKLIAFAADEKMEFLLTVVSQVAHSLHFLRGKPVDVRVEPKACVGSFDELDLNQKKREYGSC